MAQVFKLDIKLFRDFMKAYTPTMLDASNKKSFRLLESFKSASSYKQIAESDEFVEN